MQARPLTVQDALRTGAGRLALRQDLREFAKQDAQQLLEIATGLNRVRMLARPEALLTTEATGRFELLLQQRLRAAPIQYLRGSQQFYGRDFRVTPAVLIPRPETEDIVTAVLDLVADRRRPVRIADVGTGSGAIAITLALELPGSTVTAVDISREALQVAESNAGELAQRYDATLRERLRFLESDLFAAVPPESRFDVVVSNPPYIPLIEKEALHPQVSAYEPHLALFAGEDGLDIYRRLIPDAWDRLSSNGILIMETAGSTELLRPMLQEWSGVRTRPDLNGRPRVVVAVRP